MGSLMLHIKLKMAELPVRLHQYESLAGKHTRLLMTITNQNLSKRMEQLCNLNDAWYCGSEMINRLYHYKNLSVDDCMLFHKQLLTFLELPFITNRQNRKILFMSDQDQSIYLSMVYDFLNLIQSSGYKQYLQDLEFDDFPKRSAKRIIRHILNSINTWSNEYACAVFALSCRKDESSRDILKYVYAFTNTILYSGNLMNPNDFKFGKTIQTIKNFMTNHQSSKFITNLMNHGLQTLILNLIISTDESHIQEGFNFLSYVMTSNIDNALTMYNSPVLTICVCIAISFFKKHSFGIVETLIHAFRSASKFKISHKILEPLPIPLFTYPSNSFDQDKVGTILAEWNLHMTPFDFLMMVGMSQDSTIQISTLALKTVSYAMKHTDGSMCTIAFSDQMVEQIRACQSFHKKIKHAINHIAAVSSHV